MTDNQKYQNLLDGFFEGTLSTSEETALMKRMETDVDLKSEFDFQKDIIATIRETRKLELKNRLDNIDIKWYHNISNTWKVAATATIITVAALTAYYFIDMQETLNTRIDLAQSEILNKAIETKTTDIPKKPLASNTEEIKEPIVERRTPAIRVSEDSEIVNNDAVTQPAIETEQTVEVFVPDVIEEFEEVDNIKLEDATSGDINTMTPSREDLHSSVEINTVLHKKYNFHYNFSHGRLTLYGNFEDVPYEIIEINSASGKRFYLNYKDNFYNIINTNTIIPLEPVTNESLINELKIVKENK